MSVPPVRIVCFLHAGGCVRCDCDCTCIPDQLHESTCASLHPGTLRAIERKELP